MLLTKLDSGGGTGCWSLACCSFLSASALPPRPAWLLYGDNIPVCAALKKSPWEKRPVEALSNLKLENDCWILIPEAWPHPQGHRLRMLSEESNSEGGIR